MTLTQESSGRLALGWMQVQEAASAFNQEPVSPGEPVSERADGSRVSWECRTEVRFTYSQLHSRGISFYHAAGTGPAFGSAASAGMDPAQRAGAGFSAISLPVASFQPVRSGFPRRPARQESALHLPGTGVKGHTAAENQESVNRCHTAGTEISWSWRTGLGISLHSTAEDWT